MGANPVGIGLSHAPPEATQIGDLNIGIAACFLSASQPEVIILPDRGADLGVLDPADMIALVKVLTGTGLISQARV